MPLAKGVSAKSHEFNEEGNETTKELLIKAGKSVTEG